MNVVSIDRIDHISDFKWSNRLLVIINDGKIDIEKTLIVSPFEGIIQSSFVEEGDYVRIGNIVANIVDLNPIKIQGFLSETDVNKVSLGTEAIIKI